MKNIFNILVAAVLCFFLIDITNTIYKKTHWLTTSGKVIETSVGWGFYEKKMTRMRYPFHVKYTYKVDGISYSNDYSLSLSSGSVDTQKEKIFPGEKINVFYNPKKPAESFIEAATFSQK